MSGGWSTSLCDAHREEEDPTMQRHPHILFLSIRYSAAILLALLSLNRPATAQETPKLRVIVADCVNRSKKGVPDVTNGVTNALRDALAASGKYQAVDAKDISDTFHKLKLDIAHPDYIGLTRSDLFRIAKELHADAILFSALLMSIHAHGHPARTALGINLVEVSTGEPINGGVESILVKSTDQTVKQLAQDTVNQMARQILPEAAVIRQQGDNVLLDRGSRDGLRVGDEMVIERETGGQKTPVGRIHVD